MLTYDIDGIVRSRFPQQLETDGIKVETRELTDDESLSALAGRLIRMAGDLGGHPHTDTTRKLAELTSTLAEIQLITGVSDEDIAKEEEKLVEEDGSLHPHTFIATLYVPIGSEWTKHPILRDVVPRESLWT